MLKPKGLLQRMKQQRSKGDTTDTSSLGHSMICVCVYVCVCFVCVCKYVCVAHIVFFQFN